MAGLLNTLKKNWRGLLDEVQAAPESLRALTQPAAAQQFDAALRNGGTIDKEKAVQMAMDVLQTTPMGVMGKIVYHGSPHKFDKFDMSKIGTGEGAQAYGHGLYMAESPGVAKSYAAMADQSGRLNEEGTKLASKIYDDEVIKLAKDINYWGGSFDGMSLKDRIKWIDGENVVDYGSIAERFKDSHGLKQNLYKVDIPDESIPRMLDWDKPLSEQTQEVQAALKANPNYEQYWLPHLENRFNSIGENPSVADLHNYLKDDYMPDEIAELFKGQGIPGIRYLDGGSRTAGEGTSNFVLFDDRLPRILERNGQATGLQPWAPGEWKGLLD